MQELIHSVCLALQELTGVNKRKVVLKRRTSVELNGVIIPGKNCRYALKNIDLEIGKDAFVVGQLREGAMAKISGEMSQARKCVVKTIHTNS